MKVTIKDFAKSFGTTSRDIRSKCSNLNHDFSYSVITGSDRKLLINYIVEKIEKDTQVIGSPERRKVWNSGWGDALGEFISSGYDLETLVPKFIRNGQPVRYRSQYIKPTSPTFELDYFSVFREWLFKTYFEPVETVYEFGCGTGFNLVALTKLFPKKNLYGLDFVPSSVRLINTIAKHHKLNLKGHQFDMVNPKLFPLKENSAVLTIGTIEQLAGNFEMFILYLLTQPISVCIHVEPTIELYDKLDFIDKLAIKFHKKRGYTEGLLTYLLKNTLINVVKIKRLYFGSLYMEGYSLIVWKPR